MQLYRSLLRFYYGSENDIKEMLYQLNTANLDCFGYYHPDVYLVQSGPALFSQWLDNTSYRPYRTEVQLYKALQCLQYSVEQDLMTSAQREALQKLRCIISNIEYRFYKAFGMEIEDSRTIYNVCAFNLVPREDEPSVPILRDWIYRPSAERGLSICRQKN